MPSPARISGEARSAAAAFAPAPARTSMVAASFDFPITLEKKRKLDCKHSSFQINEVSALSCLPEPTAFGKLEPRAWNNSMAASVPQPFPFK